MASNDEIKSNVYKLQAANASSEDIETYVRLASGQAPTQTPAAPEQSLPSKIGSGVMNAANAVTDFVGARGIADQYGSSLARAIAPNPTQKAYIDQSAPSLGKVVGSGVQTGANIASLAYAAPMSLGRAALQYGALGSAASGGQSLQQGNSPEQIAKDATIGGGISAATGGVFNLLGKGFAKAAPTALSFTSGVPKQSILQAAENPKAAKEGLNMTLEQIHHKATGALGTLYQDLGKEFEQGLTQVSTLPPPNAMGIKATLLHEAENHAIKYGVPVKDLKGLLTPDFSKSAIVKPGEQNAVKQALQTISTWDDFSEAGMQKLSTRVGAFKDFEEGITTRSSAIVGKMYDSIGKVIDKTYPTLSELKTNHHVNKTVLDEIQNVLNSTAEKPTQQQTAITRLDKLFADNREPYIRIVKELGDRSGTDFLSLIAGTDFQKILPSFIRGIGGAGVAAAGTHFINPMLAVLLPLFSPRAVGLLSRNAKPLGAAAARFGQATTIQAIPRFQQLEASQQPK